MKNVVLLIFGLVALPSLAQIDHWESVVLPGDEWNYLVPTSQPDEGWIAADFDVSNWQIGISGFGYGDEDDATVLPNTMAVLLRKAFEIKEISEIEEIVLDIDYDDGFVAYLNGTEIARDLMTGIPAYNQSSDGLHEALLHHNQSPERFEIPKELLRSGTNILAVEVHNESLTSSDLSALPVLSLGLISKELNYHPTPNWFDVPFVYTTLTFESSNLPIVILTTDNSRTIPTEPKIPANMKIINRGGQERNYLEDAQGTEFLDYDGSIQIEVRGSSSSILPKKQYALTTYDALGEKQNVSLLGMPKENDWILSGIAFDSSLVRDYVSYQLSNRLGQYASRGHYCELVLNGVFQGLYILQEKLKADDHRININKIQPLDMTVPKLTGGYITKTDKTEGDDLAAWSMPNYGGGESNFIHEHPKPTTVTPEQNTYIKNEFYKLANAAATKNSDINNGYPSLIDIPSFIDFMILNEFAANVDGYEYSTFFHKDRNGKLRAGPVWDFNLTFGNDLFFWGFNRSVTNIWQFNNGDNMGAKFWKDLFDDPVYKCYLSKRWQELTSPGMPLNKKEVFDLIDETSILISEAALRQETLWRTTGLVAQQIDEMKSFVQARITWISANMGSPNTCQAVEVPSLVISKVNYHPSVASETDDASDFEFIEISNAGAAPVDLTGVYFGGLGLAYQFPKSVSIQGNSTLYLANETDDFKERYGFTPFDEFSRNLDNTGQKLQLLDAYGNLIDEVNYSNEAPWPASTDGEGPYLELMDLSLDNNDPANWIAQTDLPNWESLLGNPTMGPILSIYPNPASSQLYMATQGEISKVFIWDLQGKSWGQFEFNSSEVNIPLARMEEGLYLLEIVTDKGHFMRKISVAK